MTSLLHVHVENASSLMPVFLVRSDQYEAALKRHPDVAARIRTTWGLDQDIYAKEARSADAIITYRFPKETLGADAPRLKLLQILGAGVDYLLPLDWVPKGVTVLTNSGAHVPKAGLSALMTLLMLNARLPELFCAQKKRQWNRLFTTTPEGKTVLIVGVGAIGGAAATQAKDLGMRVLGIRRSRKPHPSVDAMHGPADLHAVLPEADFVLLNTALTDETRFLFGEREFAAMRRGAGFANMSRGGLVDPKALDHTLRSGHLGGAVIDVTYPEPPGEDWPYWDTPNLIITPHVLSDDLEGYMPRTLDLFFGNLRRHLDGEPLTNQVELERSY
jgi:phosphoglycerate dehydrogenase-like enzyme